MRFMDNFCDSSSCSFDEKLKFIAQIPSGIKSFDLGVNEVSKMKRWLSSV